MTLEMDGSVPRIPRQRSAVDEAQALRSIERELHLEFPAVPLYQLTVLVECLWAHFDGATVRDFVPLLVRRQAREELLDHVGPRAEAAERFMRRG
jgi:hypothetical protein